MARTIKDRKQCIFNSKYIVEHNGTTFHRMVDCEGGLCYKCGWNPVVEAERKEKIWAKMKTLRPDLEIPEHWMLGSGPFEIS